MERIESVNNKTVKYTCSLNSKKTRREEGKFIAEGERLVRDAIKTVVPEYIMVSESYSKEDFGVKTYVVTDNIFPQRRSSEMPTEFVKDRVLFSVLTDLRVVSTAYLK